MTNMPESSARRYRVGINRFLPIGVVDRGIFIASAPFIGTFELVRYSDRVAMAELYTQQPIARLVDSDKEQVWTAPTVIQENFVSRRGYIGYQSSEAMSDYRYLQLAARLADMVPVMNPEDGLIFDLTDRLDGASLRFYHRVLRIAALRTQQGFFPAHPRSHRRQTITPHLVYG